MNSLHLKSFSECVFRLHNISPDEDPLEGIMDALEMLVPVNSFSLDLVDPGKGTMTHQRDRYIETPPELAEMVPLLVSDHPGVKWTLKHGPPKAQVLSHFVSERQMRELQIYNLLLKSHHFRDQAVVLAPVPGGSMAFVINRDSSFTNEELQLLEMVQKHVAQTLSRTARYVRLPGGAHLSTRERDVLYWMISGKSDGEIAIILGLSQRTVQDHVGNILNRMGVENRTTAVSRILSSSSD